MKKSKIHLSGSGFKFAIIQCGFILNYCNIYEFDPRWIIISFIVKKPFYYATITNKRLIELFKIL